MISSPEPEINDAGGEVCFDAAQLKMCIAKIRAELQGLIQLRSLGQANSSELLQYLRRIETQCEILEEGLA